MFGCDPKMGRDQRKRYPLMTVNFPSLPTARALFARLRTGPPRTCAAAARRMESALRASRAAGERAWP